MSLLTKLSRSYSFPPHPNPQPQPPQKAPRKQLFSHTICNFTLLWNGNMHNRNICIAHWYLYYQLLNTLLLMLAKQSWYRPHHKLYPSNYLARHNPQLYVASRQLSLLVAYNCYVLLFFLRNVRVDSVVTTKCKIFSGNSFKLSFDNMALKVLYIVYTNYILGTLSDNKVSVILSYKYRVINHYMLSTFCWSIWSG